MRKLLNNVFPHDSLLICDDGSLFCNRLILGLLFPQTCLQDFSEEVAVILPDTSVVEGREAIQKILWHNENCCITRDAFNVFSDEVCEDPSDVIKEEIN